MSKPLLSRALALPVGWLVLLAVTENEKLAAKMEEVILKQEPMGIGNSVARRIISGVEQIASAYEAKQNRPLPLVFDLSAVDWIARTTTDPDHIIRLGMKDVPLPEALRGWLSICGLNYRLDEGRIVISKLPDEKK